MTLLYRNIFYWKPQSPWGFISICNGFYGSASLYQLNSICFRNTALKCRTVRDEFLLVYSRR